MKKTRLSLLYKSVLCALLLAVCATAAAPALAEAPVLSGVVRNLNGGSYVNLRAHPAYFGAILARISLGTEVEIVGREGDWYAVKVCGMSGYMHSFFVKTENKAPQVKVDAFVRTFNGGRLNLRTYASVCADSLGLYASGTPVTILDYQTTWCKVSVCGKTGYMKTDYLALCAAMTAKPAARKEAAPVVCDAATLTPAIEVPACSVPAKDFGWPSWQLSWGDPAPIVPAECFIPLG